MVLCAYAFNEARFVMHAIFSLNRKSPSEFSHVDADLNKSVKTWPADVYPEQAAATDWSMSWNPVKFDLITRPAIANYN